MKRHSSWSAIFLPEKERVRLRHGSNYWLKKIIARIRVWRLQGMKIQKKAVYQIAVQLPKYSQK